MNIKLLGLPGQQGEEAGAVHRAAGKQGSGQGGRAERLSLLIISVAGPTSAHTSVQQDSTATRACQGWRLARPAAEVQTAHLLCTLLQSAAADMIVCDDFSAMAEVRRRAVLCLLLGLPFASAVC